MAGLLLLAVALTGVAAADESAARPHPRPSNADFEAPPRDSRLPTSLQAIPAPFHLLELPDEPKLFSTQDFRPRGASLSVDPAAKDAYSRGVWDHLSDFRFHNRLRLITLWETRGSTLSLQAGHRGGPTLQWTSGLTDHGPTGHGVLDRLFSTSVETPPHYVPMPRPSPSEVPARSSKTLDPLAGYGATK